MRDIAISLMLIAALPLSFRTATSAVLLWAWSAYIDVTSVVYGFLASIPIQKIIVVFAVISLFVGKTKRRFYLDRTVALLILFVVTTFVSQSQTITVSADGWEIYGKVVKIVIFAVIITGVMWERLQIHALVITVCLALGFTGIWEGVLFFLTAGSHIMEGTPSLGDNNQVALQILMIMPLMYYVYEQSSWKSVRIASLAGCFLLAACVMGSRSRGGFAGLVIIALALSLFSRRKVVTTVLTVVIGVGLLMAAPDSWTARMHTIQAANQDTSFMGRVIAWKLSTLIALDHPIFGGGFHAVQHPEVWRHYTSSFDTLDFVPTDEPDVEPHAAHSLYFELLGDTGFLGLGIFLLLIATAFANGAAIRRRARGRPDLAWASSLAGKLQLSLVVLLVSGSALSTAYYELPYTLMAVLSVTRRQLEAQTKAPFPRSVEAAASGWRDRRLVATGAASGAGSLSPPIAPNS